MIRTIVGLALAGIALTPFAEKGRAPVPSEQMGIDPMKTGSMAAERKLVYEVSAPSGFQCRIVVAAPGSGVVEARAESACAGVYPGLEAIAGWSAAHDIVRLTDASGTIVLELGASDGFAYEAVAPASAQVTFSEFRS